MFRNAYQNGFLSILYSCGSSPLAIWEKQVKNGYIKRITDDEVKSLVLEIASTNVATTFIYCPQDPKKVLGIKLPFLIMIIKNMKKYFTFEITVLDDKDMHRRFRVSNFQSTTRVRPFCTTMPIGLSGGWNQIQFNLADFTRRAYGSNYIETTRMQIHANCRIRRIYYADRLYSEDEMPEEYKLFLPIHRRRSTREAKTSESATKSNRISDEDRLPDNPPPFAVGEESESVQKSNPADESVPEYQQKRVETAQRLSETRRGSDIMSRKSISSSKFESKLKQAAVTIRGKSQDEIIDDYQENEEIPPQSAEQIEVYNENIVTDNEEASENPRYESLDDQGEEINEILENDKE